VEGSGEPGGPPLLAPDDVALAQVAATAQARADEAAVVRAAVGDVVLLGGHDAVAVADVTIDPVQAPGPERVLRRFLDRNPAVPVRVEPNPRLAERRPLHAAGRLERVDGVSVHERRARRKGRDAVRPEQALPGGGAVAGQLHSPGDDDLRPVHLPGHPAGLGVESDDVRVLGRVDQQDDLAVHGHGRRREALHRGEGAKGSAPQLLASVCEREQPHLGQEDEDAAPVRSGAGGRGAVPRVEAIAPRDRKGALPQQPPRLRVVARDETAVALVPGQEHLTARDDRRGAALRDLHRPEQVPVGGDRRRQPDVFRNPCPIGAPEPGPVRGPRGLPQDREPQGSRERGQPRGDC
jgi:hypothetical protein